MSLRCPTISRRVRRKRQCSPNRPLSVFFSRTVCRAKTHFPRLYQSGLKIFLPRSRLILWLSFPVLHSCAFPLAYKQPLRSLSAFRLILILSLWTFFFQLIC